MTKYRLLISLALTLIVTGCSGLLGLKRELDESKTTLGRVSGNVRSENCTGCPTIVVALSSLDRKGVDTYRVLEEAGNFELTTTLSSRYIFAFNDNNGDFTFQANEPHALREIPPDLATRKKLANLDLSLSLANPVTLDFGSLLELRGLTLGNLDVQLGMVTTLADTRFEADLAGLGMWQPLSFMRAGYFGVYFLQPYDSKKIPVLFVHGINGTPRDFSALISRLDHNKYQPWVFYYPSGIDIAAMGDAMLAVLTELRHRYGFQTLHLVAHSMGGVVSRSYVAYCVRTNACRYLASFTSIASPFGGHSAAQAGLDYSPVVMPVWRTLAPGSDFMKQLFASGLPKTVPHHVVFAYRNDSKIGGGSSDGVIQLSSQLRNEVQIQAASLRGFDEDHMGVLLNEEVSSHVYRLINEAGIKRLFDF